MDVRPTCMFCHQRFSLRPGEPPTRCESWRSLDGQHVERRVATPEQHARLKLDHEPDMKHPKQIEWEKTDAYKAAAKGIPKPTPFDADALRAGKPRTDQQGLF